MKKGFMLFTLLAAFSGFAQADDAAIQQTLAKMGIKSSDIQPAPVAGMKTVLTNSGVLYITDDGKHIIQGPMYDVSGTAPVNVTNKMLLKQLNALEKEMIVYKAPQENTSSPCLLILPVVTATNCMSKWQTTTRWGSPCVILLSRARAGQRCRERNESYLVCER